MSHLGTAYFVDPFSSGLPVCIHPTLAIGLKALLILSASADEAFGCTIKIVRIGLVSKYDEATQVGCITTPEGCSYDFRYVDGQNMMSGDDLAVPRFSGHHSQPRGFRLKLPKAGDPVVFTIAWQSGVVATWGYMHHFLDLTERKYGPTFAVAR